MIDELVRRLWRAVGRYHALDWRSFASWLGLRVYRTEHLPATVPAMLFRDRIVIRAGLDDWDTAWLVWHEIGHAILHVGNRERWRRMACGDLILAKQERQASDFARNFPDWSVNAAS